MCELKLSSFEIKKFVIFEAGVWVSNTNSTTIIQMNGNTSKVCFHVSKLNPISKQEISGAIILTERIKTINKNKLNSFPLRGNFI